MTPTRPPASAHPHDTPAQDSAARDTPAQDTRTQGIQAQGVFAGYDTKPVIHDITLHVQPGEVVALLGPNGAGKTTTILTLVGELRPQSGTVRIDGVDTRRQPLHRRARHGLAYISEERSVIKALDTRSNLTVAGVAPRDALELFPELERVLSTPGGLLSGGQQQMLTLARALARRPQLLLADELSLGLAPLVVTRLLDAIRHTATEHGTAVLLVEQHVRKALRYADRAYIMQAGHLVLEGSAEELGERIDEIESSYLTGADRP